MGDYIFMGEKKLDQNGLEFENIELPTEQQDSGQDPAVEFSVKLVEFLDAKAKSHNSECLDDQKVSLTELKRVYSGAGDCYHAKEAGVSCSMWALARVNMFLRQKLGGKMIISEASIQNYNLIDISEMWLPSDEDYIKANEEIADNGLDYDFKNVDELYIQPYERLEITEW
tara:strand:+ start:275 stop:787 length:513 start_codon:yes stop_codon:yes gene_type:complete